MTSSPQLTVLQVLPALDTGGVERGTVDIAEAIMSVGGRALVASAGGKLELRLLRSGAEHFKLPLASKNPLTMFANVGRLVSIIRENKVELVHARSRAPAWSAYLAARRCGVPFVTTFHGAYSTKGGSLKRAYNAVMTKGDRVIAVSQGISEHMQQVYGTVGDKIRVIHRGVDTRDLNPKTIDPKRVVYLYEQWKLPDDKRFVTLPGRITRWKGQHLLIEAMRHVKAADACALIVGPGDGHEDYVLELHELIRKHKLEDRVILADACDDMASLYALSDVVVSASIRPEPFGRITAEAMAMGVPTVAPAYGGAAEQILHGQTGWLFEPQNPLNMSQAIDHALSLTPEQRQQQGDAARQRALDYFSKEQMAQATLNVYAELL